MPPRRNLDLYFGLRNNKTINPKLNQNYTTESLKKMMPRDLADIITNSIIAFANVEKINTLNIVEYCAGIGGNSFSFLDNSKVKFLTMYETNKNRRKILETNIKSYEFDTNRYAIHDKFEGVSSNLTNAILYLDIPTNNIKDILDKNRHVAAIYIRLPKEFNLEKVENYKMITKEFDDFSLVIATPMNSNIIRKKKEKTRNIPSLISTKKTVEEEVLSVELAEIKNTLEWKKSLQKFLFEDILSIVLPDVKERILLLNNDYMKLWAAAFTHPSADPNLGHNYEELETMGDKMMEVTFVRYIKGKYPTLDKEQLTEMIHEYVSKSYQGDLGSKLGLNNHVNTLIPVDLHMNEDLLESLYGALWVISTDAFKDESKGYYLCYMLTLYLYGDLKIDPTMVFKSDRNKVKETFDKLGWGDVISTVERIDDTVKIILSMPYYGPEFLRDNRINVNTPILAEELGNTETVATKKAYASAVKYLNRIGVTPEWLIEIKGNEFQRADYIPYYSKVKQKAEESGYIDFKLINLKGGVSGMYSQFIGIKENGKKEILSTGFGNKYKDSRLNAFRLYAEGK